MRSAYTVLGWPLWACPLHTWPASLLPLQKTPGVPAPEETEEAAANRVHWTSFAKELWLHVLQDCDMSPDCTHPGCCNARAVINHMLTCKVRAAAAHWQRQAKVHTVHVQSRTKTLLELVDGCSQPAYCAVNPHRLYSHMPAMPAPAA
jgi:hypothetical protein